MEINRPKITLESSCGLVRKAQLREALNASMWEFAKTIKHLCEYDKDFEVAYLPYLKNWSMPVKLATQFVEHVCPGWEVEIVV
jgi:hypothetical protein